MDVKAGQGRHCVNKDDIEAKQSFFFGKEEFLHENFEKGEKESPPAWRLSINADINQIDSAPISWNNQTKLSV